MKTTTRLRATFSLLALLALTAAAPACSMDGPSADASEDALLSNRSTLDLIKDLPPDTHWESVPARVKQALSRNAEKTLASYARRFAPEALEEQVRALATPSPSAAKGFDDFVRRVYGPLLPDARSYDATTAMNPTLRYALNKLYVVRIAAWRLNVRSYGNMNALESDGTTAIDEFPLPSAAAIASYRAVAAEAVAELRAAQALPLSAPEKAISERALDHARTHAAGSTGFRYGSEDLLSVWGRGGWAYDLVFARTEGGGKFLQDDVKYAETLNAYYGAPLTSVDKGTVFALPFLTDGLVDQAFLEGELGAGPDEAGAVKAYLLLTRWWLERTSASKDTQTACTVYAQREEMWEGFAADNLFGADGSTTLAAFRGDADAEAVKLLALYRSVLVDAVRAFAAGHSLPSSVVDRAASEIQAETKYGALGAVAAASLETHAAGLGAAFTTALGAIPTVGGYGAGEAVRPADSATIQRIWSDVKGFLSSTYGLDTSKLQAEIAVAASTNTAVTGQDGKISIGIKTQRTEDYWYSTLLHESHHSYNHAQGVFVEGPGWEGAAKATEIMVFPALIEKTLAARGEGAKTPYYLATSFAGRNAFSAKTEATLDVLLRGSCSGIDTVTSAQDTARKWGITDPALVDDVAVRSHHGTSYLQYVAGEIIYTAYVAKLSAAVGKPVDPFQLQACGLAFAPDGPATVTALQTCLAK